MKILNKVIILVLVVIGLIISSCGSKPTCNKPYILVGNECCLDKDGNSICDKDERGLTTPAQVVQEKENCPFECCVNSDYKIKECAQDYECKSNKCVAIDSDGDGLTDIEEKQLGTNIRLADTDNDGLTDYQEVKIYNTDPLNPNKDGDRYLDGEEIKLGKNPLVKNSANITVDVKKVEDLLKEYDIGGKQLYRLGESWSGEE